MALAPQKFREILFQLLYSRDMGDGDVEALQKLLMRELAVPRSVLRKASEKMAILTHLLEEIDSAIVAASVGYELERIPYVERNILRLGIFELRYEEGVPPKVAIAEAIRLARKFSTPESASFINAVLDSLYKESRGEEVDSAAIVAALPGLDASERGNDRA